MGTPYATDQTQKYKIQKIDFQKIHAKLLRNLKTGSPLSQYFRVISLTKHGQAANRDLSDYDTRKIPQAFKLRCFINFGRARMVAGVLQALECFQEKHAPAKAGVDTGFPSGNTTKQRRRAHSGKVDTGFRPNARQNKDLRAHSGKVKTDILGRLRGIIRNGPTKARRNKKKPTRVNGAI